MAQNFPSASKLNELFVQIYEVEIGQDAPLNDKADIRIRAKVWSMIAQLVSREVIDSSLQNFALTASRETLINVFGREYKLPIKDEESAILTVILPATADGVQLTAGTNFTGDDNGILYFNPVPATTGGGSVTLDVTARTPGVIGNLQIGQTLSIAREFPGVEKTATITAIVNTGAESEETEVYRQRVLDIIRAPGGGANSADFRNWGQEQEGVDRCFPYSGIPFDEPGYPGASPNRTNYIEADESIDVDGIAPQPLLDETRASIITDPVTGLHRQPLGITNDTLFVVSIRRNPFYVTVSGAVFLPGTESQVKVDIDTAVTNYFLALFPFIQGLDVDSDRNDLITSPAISDAVQPVLQANGASAIAIFFSTSFGGALEPKYSLQPGEKAKNGGVAYT